MRRPALFVAAVVALGLVLGATAALAQDIVGGCTVSASSALDSTIVTDATRDEPFQIDPAGSISWNAASPQAIMNHSWVIGVEVGGIGVRVAQGGDPNTAGTLTSTGSRTIPELIAQAEATGAPNAELLSGLRGLYLFVGTIHGEGGTCVGQGYVRILGNPLSETPGQAAAGVATAGTLLMLFSGIAKKG